MLFAPDHLLKPISFYSSLENLFVGGHTQGWGNSVGARAEIRYIEEAGHFIPGQTVSILELLRRSQAG